MPEIPDIAAVTEMPRNDLDHVLSVPFAFATGFGRASLPEAFHDVPILGKPFGTEQLVAMLRALLSTQAGAPALGGS